MTARKHPRSVEAQAEVLATLCQMPSIWVDWQLLVVGQWKVKSENIVYDLQKIQSGIMLKGTQVSYCCQCRKKLEEETPVVVAKVRKRLLLQNERGKTVDKGRAAHIRKQWCLDCAKNEANKHNGSLGWLAG